MKVLHVCLAAFYVDNYSYQENILPRMHKKLGHEVQILASTETYIEGRKLGYVNPSEYVNEDGFKVTRIPYVKWLPLKIAKKLRIYVDFSNYLKEFKPDVIFLHDVQFLSIEQIIKYAKENNVRVLADGHTDYVNSARTFASKLLHKYIYTPFIHRAEPYIETFFGTLPARVEFFKNVYGIPENKISFLPMGADDDLVDKCKSSNTMEKLYKKYHFTSDDFIIVTGGKITVSKKQVLLLMKAVKEINNKKLKLLVFGTIAEELKNEFEQLCSDNIVYAGWATVEQSYEYFELANLVVFPTTHSVYWEQAAGMGKPLVLKYWEGITHIDQGGNVIFIRQDTVEEIKTIINELVNNPKKFNAMKTCAETIGCKLFSYRSIAKQCLK